MDDIWVQFGWVVVKHTVTKHSHTHLQTLPRREEDTLLLPVIAKLNGGAVKDTAEGDRLDFPVRHRVAEQTNARVHSLLRVETRGTEVLCSHSSNLVGMEVDHLVKRFT